MTDSLAALRGVPLFAELPEPDLLRIAARARLVDVAAGTEIIREGTPPDALYLVERGELAVTKRGHALNTCGPGDLLGELGVLEDRPRTATVTARTDARLIVVDSLAIHDLLRGSPTAALAILRTMATRLGNTEAVLREHDTLAGLGRIAAGLAHELNNPASAVKRGAVDLDALLADVQRTTLVMLDADTRAALQALAEPRPALAETAMQRARREQALEAALERHQIERAWELAPALASSRWDVATLEAALALGPAALHGLRWVIAVDSARLVARDVAEAAGRISELVAAVRQHSHLGEAPVQEVDLHAGLDSTLALFKHKLGAVTVRRDYGELPKIAAHGSELNQVWTNLIDNALHAMAGTGELVIATHRDGDHVIVDVIDTGPGIPAQLLPEIWKPFFTTKGVGEGTGLGLHLARNVVVQRHRGSITATSRPGHTCFRVRLPG